MISKTKKIFDYTDYTEYLGEWFREKRNQSSTFSFQTFATKAGFKSRSYIQFVLKGKRPLSLKSIPKVTQALELNKKQTQYFEAMVFFKESHDHDTKTRYYELMQNWVSPPK